MLRSSRTFARGRGPVFYFSPGDQAYPIYHQPQIRRVLANATLWAARPAPRELPAVVHPEKGWTEGRPQA